MTTRDYSEAIIPNAGQILNGKPTAPPFAIPRVKRASDFVVEITGPGVGAGTIPPKTPCG
ncbi:MAG: hypothetical protein MUO26_00755 [Methanotrichaceae archaeon]|nr:hypothetical protein [Methanotrichaceae archaeon]